MSTACALRQTARRECATGLPQGDRWPVSCSPARVPAPVARPAREPASASTAPRSIVTPPETTAGRATAAYTPPARPAPGAQAAPPSETPAVATRHGWRSLAILVLAAAATVLAADLAARRLAAPVHRKEVQDGVAELRTADPDVLVLGSSHARTFAALAGPLAERTGGDQTLVAIPVEAGKLSSYQWVLENRLVPLLDERDASGQLVRPSLSRFVLITEWWDSCRAERPWTNLPSRAWTFRHFAADVARNGITDYNRNYLQTRWSRLFWQSSLVQDRGQGRVLVAIRSALGFDDAAREASRIGSLTEEWRGMVENGDRCLGDPVQVRAMSETLAWARARGLETTLVLFPRKPSTISEKAKATTLARFATLAADVAAAEGARFVDLTTKTPLRDDEFMADFDHVSIEGNRRFAAWSLDNDLRYLLQPAPRPAVATAGGAR